LNLSFSGGPAETSPGTPNNGTLKFDVFLNPASCSNSGIGLAKPDLSIASDPLKKSASNSYSAQFTGLSKGTQYTACILASDSAGNQAFQTSSPVTTTNYSPPQSPTITGFSYTQNAGSAGVFSITLNQPDAASYYSFQILDGSGTLYYVVSNTGTDCASKGCAVSSSGSTVTLTQTITSSSEGKNSVLNKSLNVKARSCNTLGLCNDLITSTLPALTVLPLINKVAATDGQTGYTATPLSSPFKVTAYNPLGSAYPNYALNWTVTSGGGSLSASSTLTGADGVASSTLTLGSSPVSNTVTVSDSAGQSLIFSASGGQKPFSLSFCICRKSSSGEDDPLVGPTNHGVSKIAYISACNSSFVALALE
jgi:hypothetical protein